MSNDDDIRPERDDWCASPFTQVSLERVKKEHVPAILDGLLRVCKSSSDPMVTRWLEKYRAALDLEEFLRTGDLPK